MSKVIQPNTPYPIKDFIPFRDLNKLGLNHRLGDIGTKDNQVFKVMAVWTGEKRNPIAGEWFLSGSIIEAYRAKLDMGDEFHIAKLVKTVTETRIIIVE